jgi:hypothetical protein
MLVNFGGVAEWSKATVLKTVGRKLRGFESLLLLKLREGRCRPCHAALSSRSRPRGPFTNVQKLGWYDDRSSEE